MHPKSKTSQLGLLFQILSWSVLLSMAIACQKPEHHKSATSNTLVSKASVESHPFQGVWVEKASLAAVISDSGTDITKVKTCSELPISAEGALQITIVSVVPNGGVNALSQMSARQLLPFTVEGLLNVDGNLNYSQEGLKKWISPGMSLHQAAVKYVHTDANHMTVSRHLEFDLDKKRETLQDEQEFVRVSPQEFEKFIEKVFPCLRQVEAQLHPEDIHTLPTAPNLDVEV